MREIPITSINISKDYGGKWGVNFISYEKNLSLAGEREDLILRMDKFGDINGYFLVEDFFWSDAEREGSDEVIKKFKVKGTSDKVRIYKEKDEIVKEKI